MQVDIDMNKLAELEKTASKAMMSFLVTMSLYETRQQPSNVPPARDRRTPPFV